MGLGISQGNSYEEITNSAGISSRLTNSFFVLLTIRRTPLQFSHRSFELLNSPVKYRATVSLRCCCRSCGKKAFPCGVASTDPHLFLIQSCRSPRLVVNQSQRISLLCYITRKKERRNGFISFPTIHCESERNEFGMDLNSALRFHFAYQ